MIDKLTAQKIKDAADIVEVVGDYVRLTRRGANYMGLCPFHNERTPSFSVNKAKNFCYCFSCHKGGGPVNFIMEKEGIGYQDALRQLAKKYGIIIEERELTDEERAAQSERESLFIANEWAMREMQKNLTETDEGKTIGLQYLYERGITEAAVKAFRLGYALDSFSALQQAATNSGFDIEPLLKTGLLGKSQQGRVYDRFRGRVIFPVLNTAGKVVAFGGRDLKGGPAKYINSPESAIYKKSNELYGIHQAKSSIVKEDKCFLVEGYMDVIGMWQSGLENAVASSGTALTDGQIALLHRFTNNVTLLYDGDNAGIKASLRGIDMLLSHNLNVKVLLLPDGHDPDSFARQHTPEEFKEYIATHETDFITYKAQTLLHGAKADPQSRAQAVMSIVESLASISDKVKRSIYVRECSRMMGVEESILQAETDKKRNQVVAGIRLERERKNLSQKEETEKEPEPVNDTQVESDLLVTIDEKLKRELIDIEREVIRYSAKYGVMDFCINTENPDEMISVLKYIDNDIIRDKIKFASSENEQFFIGVKKIAESYPDELDKFMHQVEAERKEAERKEYDRIANLNLSMAEIEQEEKNVANELDAKDQERITAFAKDFIFSHLVSHEDDSLRRKAITLLTSPYTLSKYHNKLGHVVKEEDRLTEVIPHILTVWKGAILKNELKELNIKLKEASEKKDTDEIIKLMKLIQEKQELRKSFAAYSGDRIIQP